MKNEEEINLAMKWLVARVQTAAEAAALGNFKDLAVTPRARDGLGGMMAAQKAEERTTPASRF